MRSKLIQKLFADHAGALQVFFRRRAREQRDAADLTQEVYLRLLRVEEGRIHNPEAYLFTVANNLLRERHVMNRRQEQRMDLSHPAVADALNCEALMADDDPATNIDLQSQVRELRAAIPELPPRCQHVLMMAFEEELSHQQIAQRLGVSKTMVHKILTRAISECRKRLAEREIP